MGWSVISFTTSICDSKGRGSPVFLNLNSMVRYTFHRKRSRNLLKGSLRGDLRSTETTSNPYFASETTSYSQKRVR